MTKLRRLNRYSCKCGNSFLSEDVDEGVTPFMMACGACGGDAHSSFYRVGPDDQVIPADVEWYKPTPAEVRKLTRPMQDHVKQGGLVYRVVSKRPAVRSLEEFEGRQWR